MKSAAPLAEQLRPQTFTDLVGQEHLAPFFARVAQGKLPNLLFHGPPGTGKTTAARLLAATQQARCVELSAIDAGVKEVRDAIAIGEAGEAVVLFLDEIHRFTKAQQDRLLKATERGVITLIGATTENPSFTVIPALLSRCRVLRFRALSAEALSGIVERGIAAFPGRSMAEDARELLIAGSGGDARMVLLVLEIALSLTDAAEVSRAVVEQAFGDRRLAHDRAGENHYDTASAFIKSMRGSDADAALYYMARLTEGGEDPLFIARRMLIFAAEDIGNANPNALLLATTCMQAVQMTGYPECSIPLAQTAIYLARSAKSRASYDALRAAEAAARDYPNEPIPLHLRNPVTKLMQEEGYGAGYRMPHQAGFAEQEYLPGALRGKKLYRPSGSGSEK